MTQLHAYLGFNGKTKEAMEFYKSIFGGELMMQTMGESPMASQIPEDAKNNILHAELKTNTFTIMASDMAGDTAQSGEKVSLCLVCESKEDIETLYQKLSEGGSPEHPLKEEFFGTFGDLYDRYGIRWMLQYSAEQPKA